MAESFLELAGSKNIDKITVKDITDNCGYSTATFYRQFKDKYDLIAWQYTSSVAKIMSRIGSDDYDWKRTLRDGAYSFQENKDYLANLLLHTSGHDQFILYMTEINFNELKKYLLKSSGREDLDMKTEMYARQYCMGCVCLACEWIFGKYPVSPEELAEIFEKSLPEPLHEYLL